MNEEFLSYVWQFRRYSANSVLVCGRNLQVEFPGTPNKNAGPDFTEAKIRIDQTKWAGNIEIHVRSSDWNLHKHSNDPSYESVILHVVFIHDVDIYLSDNTPLPVFELKDHIKPNLYTRYLQFMAASNDIPCSGLLKQTILPVQLQWLVSLGLQRFIRKGNELTNLFTRLNNNWHELFYVSFCRSMGNKINDDVFEMLALKTPLKIVRKYSEEINDCEALLFGQSGLLPMSKCNDDYITRLQSIYKQIAYKHNCIPVEPHHWKFLRTRPANFPTIRIAQLAVLLKNYTKLNPMMVHELRSWINKAVKAKVSKYWREHYHFGKSSSKLNASIGKHSLEKIVINGFLPPLIKYSEIYKNNKFICDIIDFISSIPPEDNSIIKKWNQLEVNPSSALESQGLIELYNEYCRAKRCLECRFGLQLLAKTEQ